MNTRGVMSWTAVVVTSLGFHAAVFAAFGGSRTALPRAPKPPSFMELAALSPQATGEAPAADPGPARAVARRAVVKRSAPKTATPPSEAPPAAQDEAPADFTGTTLTSAGVGTGSSWSSATGSGERMVGPVGRPGARATGESAGDAAGAPVVGAGDISRLPVAPILDDALERNYPTFARRAGHKGEAMVRARIMPDGRVRELRVVSESSTGFGPACVATLAQSRWTAPINRDGNAVSTYIHYTCRFEVR